MIDTKTDVEAGMYGPLGWTAVRGINDFLMSFCSSRYPTVDFFTFEGAGAEQAQFLLNALPEHNLRDRQNNGPILEETLKACMEHPGLVTMEGYVVGHPRWDERVSVDGFTVHATAICHELRERICETASVWKLVRTMLHFTTQEGPDDLAIVPMSDPHSSEDGSIRLGWRLWWD